MSSAQVSHDVLIAAIKSAVIKDKQVEFVKNAANGVVYLDFSKLCASVKKSVPAAKDTSIRQRIYNVNAKLKKEAKGKKGYRQFKFPPVARKGRAAINYTNKYSFDI
jgi:hypothetical protein